MYKYSEVEPMKYAYTNGVLLDGSADMQPQRGMVLRTDGEKILDIVPEGTDLTGFEIVDLRGGYLMPGLINLHVHLPASGSPKKQGNPRKLVKFMTSMALARRIAVANVRGYSTDSVAQVTVGLVLALVSHLPTYCAAVSDGTYSHSGQANLLTPPYRELAGMTWGVLGAGQIGSRVAGVARAFGCRVLTCRRHPDGSSVSLETLLRESDIVTIHTPLTEETRGMIGKDQLALLRPGAILVNMARGAVTDEAAVAEAILAGRLGGFGADVYSTEPFGAEHPFSALLGMPQVCLTPHMSWGALEARERCLREMILNMQAFFRGELRNRVDC